MESRLAQLVRVKAAIKLTITVAALGLYTHARGDDVSLIPGTSFKQAIGGRVKGQVQSESPSEVVVALGATTTSVPTDQIQSIRYDGQSASFQLAEARESSGQLAEAAELFKKAAAESAGKPFPLQAAQFREAEVLTDLALVEPDRVKEARDKLAAFVRAYPTSRHMAAARDCQARLQLHTGDFAGAEAAISELAKLPRGAGRAGCPPYQDPRQARQTRRGDYAARQVDRQLSQGLGTPAGGAAWPRRKISPHSNNSRKRKPFCTR